jgi:large conductance mechanosensitive channel
LLLTPALKALGASDIGKLTWGAVKYGNFLAAVIKFIVIAFVLFLIIKAINSTKKKEVPPPPPGPSSTDQLLIQIRDELKNKP